MKIEPSEIDLLKEAFDHYKVRLDKFEQDADLQNQLAKRQQIFLGPLQSEAQRKIQDIQQTSLPMRLTQDLNLSQYRVDLFEEALEQYKEDLSEIKKHVPVGLRKQIDGKTKAIEDLLQKLK